VAGTPTTPVEPGWGMSVSTYTPTLAATGSGGSLTSGKKYYYVVTALNSSWGETLGTIEQNFTATSTGKIKITLPTNYPGVSSYNIYRTTTAGVYTGTGNGLVGANVATSSMPYTDTGTTPTAGTPPTPCTNTSILHLEEGKPGITLGTTSYTDPTNYVPINMYDPREGEVRDSSTATTAAMNGIMNIMEVDVGNLQKWLGGSLIPPVTSCTSATPLSCGPQALNSSGYILYTSDRRGNVATSSYCSSAPVGQVWCNENKETGEYGYEDIINRSSGTGTPDGSLEPPVAPSTQSSEDVNGNGLLDTYGGIAHPINTANEDSSSTTKFPTGSSTTLGTTFWSSLTSPSASPGITAPLTRLTSNASAAGYYEAEKNPVIFFRRALRLVNGSLGNLPPLAAATMATCPNAQSPATTPAQGGFTAASENPIYVLGDYNASAAVGAFSPDPSGKCHVPAAVIGDAVTLLSNDWNDSVTFTNPTARGSRPQTTHNAFYRMAIISGKNNSFKLPTFTSPAAPNKDFGTDGGTHNFLRYIEYWNTTLNYLGAMVSFYIARQATGIYKCCNTVYDPPTRAYAFDTDFKSISSLPPGTPRFTDVNALSFQQMVLATQ
jgi:hypothetical protein